MIEITEVSKNLIKEGNPTSFYRVTFRANGELAHQYMHLNNELPDDIFKQILARIAKRLGNVQQGMKIDVSTDDGENGGE